MTAIAMPCLNAATERLPARSAARCSEPEFSMAACLARVHEGDEDAARELVQQLYPLVLKLVRSHLPRRTAEEDLAQMVFMKIFTNLRQYAGRVPLEHWVSRITINTCLNQLRLEKVRPELRWADLSEDECEMLGCLARTTDEALPGSEMASREVLERMLSRLNPEDRLVLHMLHVEECSIEEIRKVTGWSVSLIKVRAFRARHKLRRRLSRLLEEGLS